VRAGQRLEAQAPARPILNLAATDRVDHLAVGDREQPRKRATALRSIARKRRERSRECLRREVRRELAVAGAAQEEGEDSVHPPAVEEPKCLRVVAASNEQRLISGIIIDTHDYYIVNASNL
jgi:hypothetical protein